jgi:hypothetical protein
MGDPREKDVNDPIVRIRKRLEPEIDRLQSLEATVEREIADAVAETLAEAVA